MMGLITGCRTKHKQDMTRHVLRALGPSCTLAQVNERLAEHGLRVTHNTYAKRRREVFGKDKPEPEPAPEYTWEEPEALEPADLAEVVPVEHLWYLAHLQGLARRVGGWEYLRELIALAERTAGSCKTLQPSPAESNPPAAIC